MVDFSQAVELIQQGQRFIVACHRRPDSDAVGSAIGFMEILRSLGKDALLYLPEEPPPVVEFLLQGYEWVESLEGLGKFDARWAMDTAAEELLPDGLAAYTDGGPLVIVDHHSAHGEVGDVVVRDIHACATAEVVYDLSRVLGLEAIPAPARVPLYAAMSADTGGFRYSSTTAKVLRIAAEFVEGGVDPWTVNYALFERWSLAKMSLLARVVQSIETDLDGRLALLKVDARDLETTGATVHDIEGMVDYGRRLDGVEVAALVWQDGADSVKVSLRSRGQFDVSEIAVALGGGGHRSAAGAKLNMSLTAAIERVRLEASTLMP